jgi:hypothetical protein
MNAGEFDQPIFDATYFKTKIVNNDKIQAICILCNDDKALIFGDNFLVCTYIFEVRPIFCRNYSKRY